MSASAKPPSSCALSVGALSSDTGKASLIEYPCDFPIKVMGASTSGFAESMAELVQKFDPSFNPATIEIRPSKAGNYISLTLTIRATSRVQLDSIYLALTSHPMVKVAL